MELQVKLYCDIKQFAPGDTAVFNLTLPSPSTLGDVIDILKIPPAQAYTILLNGRRAEFSKPIEKKSILVILPEITGG